MSLTVATCKCGRRYYRFGDEREAAPWPPRLLGEVWDSHAGLEWCPACVEPGAPYRKAEDSAVAGWAELDERAEASA